MSARLRQVLMICERRSSGQGAHDLSEAKMAVLLAGALLEQLHDDYPEMMREWRPGVDRSVDKSGEGAAQGLAGLLTGIVGELNRAVALAEGARRGRREVSSIGWGIMSRQ
jgi:hypothetical protein